MVNKGNHPQMALIQVSEILYFTQIDDFPIQASVFVWDFPASLYLVQQLVKILFSWLIHMFASKFIFLSRGPRVCMLGSILYFSGYIKVVPPR